MKNSLLFSLLLFLFACGTKEETKEKTTDIPAANKPPVAITTDSLLESINRKIRADINNKDLYLERALYLDQTGNAKEAMADIDRAYRMDSVYLPTLLAQAEFLSSKGQLEASERILNKANLLYPENSEVHAQYSKIYLIGRNNSKSLRFADLAIKYDLFNADAYYLKGYNFLEMGDTTKAISSYQTAIEQDPKFFDAYVELGLIFSLQDNPLALDYYRNALEIKPNDKNVLYSKGMYEQEHEMYNEAMATYLQAVKVHPDFKEAHYNLGYVHLFYLKLYRESQRYFTDAIEADPRYVQAYYNRGYAAELLGDIQNAAKDYRNALKIDPTYDFAAEGLSRLNN